MNTQELMRKTLLTPKQKPRFDAVDVKEDEVAQELFGASDYAEKDIQLSAIAALFQWAETEDLDNGETYADALQAMMVGVADSNKDGEITEDEQEVVDIALNAVWDYLLKIGADEADVDILLNDWNVDAAERIHDLLIAAMPDGVDAENEAMDDFVFSDDDQESLFDSANGGEKLVVKKGAKIEQVVWTGDQHETLDRLSNDKGLDKNPTFPVGDNRAKKPEFKGQVAYFESGGRRSNLGIQVIEVEAPKNPEDFEKLIVVGNKFFVKTDFYGKPMLDSAMLDAVYKKKLVIRGGKKVRIRKRVSGVVRLSAKRKAGLKKARLKSHSASAQLKRRKSLRIRSRMGL